MFNMYSITHSRLATAFLFTLINILSACSKHPINVVKYSAGETLLIDRVKVDRQRQFVIPPLSHIAWVVDKAPSNMKHSAHLQKQLQADGLYTFSHVFADVTQLTSQQPLPGSVDFVIKAKLLDAQLRRAPKPPNSTEPSDNNSKADKPSLLKRIGPYSALLKLELIDARSRKSLDVAVVRARSGYLGSWQFSPILKQGLRAYSKSITSTSQARY